MKKTVIFSIITILCFCANAFAEVSIKAEVDKLNLTTDEVLTYKLTITATEKNVPQPQLPSFSDFLVISQSKTSNFSFAGKGLEGTIVLNLILAPQSAGEFHIEPATFKIKNKTYSSESFRIKVRQGKARIKPQPEKKHRLPEEGAGMPRITL